MVVEGITQPIVGRDSAGQRHAGNLQVACGEAQLLHQDIDDGALERGSQVIEVVLDKLGIIPNPVAQGIVSVR